MEKKRKHLKPVHIEATTISDAWYQCINKLIREKSEEYKIDRGSYEGQNRRGFDYINVHIKTPGVRPLAPIMPESSGIPSPSDDETIENDYLPYLLTDERKPNEDYTYGERIITPRAVRLSKIVKINSIKKKTGIDISNLERKDIKEKLKKYYPKAISFRKQEDKLEIFDSVSLGIHPLEELVKMYNEGGHGTNQATLEIGSPSDVVLEDPPCLRTIDTRVRNGKLHFMVYFRSWDLWGGFPENLGGLQLMKELLAYRIGVNDGEMIVASKGLHLYDYVWETAEALVQAQRNQNE